MRVPFVNASLRRAIRIAIEDTEPDLNAKQTTVSLIEQFHSPFGVMQATAEEMRALTGVPEKLALLLSLVPDLNRYLERERAFEKRRMQTLKDISPLLKSLYLGECYESCHITSLTIRGELIDCKRIQSGTVNESPFYMRLAIEEALRTEAGAIVLSHNHPAGSKFASNRDADTTRELIKSLAIIGVHLIDHVIVADGATVSMRRETSAMEYFWRINSPLPSAFQNWLSD